MRKIFIIFLINAFISIFPTTIHSQHLNGNAYGIIEIGDQQWMKENLNVAHFRNGELIPEARTKEEWKTAIINRKPAWVYYENDPKNGELYGRLYNRYAVNDSRCLCPAGWKVPTDEDWKQLSVHLGMDEKDLEETGWRGAIGSKLKSIRTEPEAHPRWNKPNGDATNESGFSAIPGGYRIGDGEFRQQGHEAVFWSSTAEENLMKKEHITEAVPGEEDAVSANWARALWSSRPAFYRNYARDHGFSVRCIKE